MKTKKLLCLLTIFVSVSVIKAHAQRVVIIGLDGFSTEGFNGAKHPNIDALFATGTLSLKTRPVMPSVTLPNWTSHLTGSGPEEHGVTSNAWTVQKHELEPTATDAEGYYPSVFKVLKENVRGIKTGFFYNWAELINSFNKKYIDDVSFEENDGYKNNYSKAAEFLAANKAQPTLLFLYSVHTDHAGHGYGWMSPQYIKAIEEADLAIGKFITDLKKRGLFKDTYFLFITDHGGKDKGHGGTSMREMQVPWAITGPKIKNLNPWETNYNSNRYTSMVLAKIFGVKKQPACWTGILPAEIFR